jgi:tagatose 1,6-diphosphate aldolase
VIPGLCDENGRIGVLAIDHRDSLRAVINPEAPDTVGRSEIVALKKLILDELAALATGVMLEPEYSIPELVAGLPDGIGFTAALESQGYSADPSSVPVELLEGWSVEQAKAAGASAAKLLAYYSESSPDHAAAQRATITSVVAECSRLAIPLLLEPLGFPGEPHGPGTIAAVTATMPLGATVMKVAWPGEDHLGLLVDALQDRPWVMLSGGGPFEQYLDQVGQAVAQGCSGFMAGRAVWREVTQVTPDEQVDVLRSIAAPRLTQLRGVL